MKNDNQVKEDINGRLHSIDQNVRSVERRLRAVERRLSVDVALQDIIEEYEIDPEKSLEGIREDITAILSDIAELKQGRSHDPGLEEKVLELGTQISMMDSHITELREENKGLSEQLEKNSSRKEEEELLTRSCTRELKQEISRLSMRLERAENRNRISIGSVKVPVELSGIVGALILTLTGILIMQGRWDIIRSAYFSFAIALVFAMAVLLKFYMANSKKA
jgi:chromosome segregation ATPase